jgi:hypothetical protein
MHIEDERPTTQLRYCAFFHQLMLDNQGTQYPGFMPWLIPSQKVDARPTMVETLN